MKIGASTKSPDYSFRVGPERKFFVETKKPSVNIKQDIAPAFQLRRYGWSAKLALSILTDFEEFAVYDCRVRPVKTASSSTARVMYVTFDQYEERWDEMLSGSQAKSEVGWEPCPSVASKPNDLAGERRGFRSRSTPGDGNKIGS